MYRRSRSQMFFRVGVLKNFVSFTGIHLCQDLFFNKVAGLFLRTPFFREHSVAASVCTFG